VCKIISFWDLIDVEGKKRRRGEETKRLGDEVEATVRSNLNYYILPQSHPLLIS
jgi:hypothetical protein